MKLIRVLVVLCLFFTSNDLFSQTWDGNNTTSGIGSIGTSSSSLYKFRIYNSGSTSPTGLRIDNYYNGSSTKYGIYSYISTTSSGDTYGLYTQASSGGTGTKYGLYARVDGSNNYAVYGYSGSSNSYAGYFRGKLEILGGDLYINNSNSGSQFTFHNQWQVGGERWLQIAPGDGSGNWNFSRSLQFFDDGTLTKNIDNASSTALAVSLNGTRNFQVMGSGKVYAREVEVTLNAFPDYVFEKEYDLLSLEELQQYIDENQHLPNVPSAQEVEENGIGLGELSLKQLEKIEELTLYILELNKRIENLEKQLSEARKGKSEN